MQRKERIPLHNHEDFYSGGVIAAHTIVQTAQGGFGGGAAASIPDGTYVRAKYGGEEVYYDLGTLGAAGTVDLVNGNYHYGTLGTAVTLAFTGANASWLAAFTLELTQDGTGNRTVTFPAEVFGGTALAAGLGTAASETSVFVFFTRDGGTNWFGFQAGGSSSAVGALNDLTDVTITSATEDDMLQYVGGIWVNNSRRWEGVTNGEDVFVWVGDDLVHEWKEY